LNANVCSCVVPPVVVLGRVFSQTDSNPSEEEEFVAKISSVGTLDTNGLLEGAGVLEGDGGMEGAADGCIVRSLLLLGDREGRSKGRTLGACDGTIDGL
jgi:hypothetical protein